MNFYDFIFENSSKGDIAIVFGNEKINYVSLKKRIKLQSEKFNVYKKNYIVITENSPIEAIVDFFAAILCKKKPVLVNSNVQ
ncbi:hypothetical protein TQ13_14810 [Listeria monocytogenes]|nr:hypothetical protein [Listeria monocytogenes]EAE5647844.1 hypothetical protein [Listeria monocytogenes]